MQHVASTGFATAVAGLALVSHPSLAASIKPDKQRADVAAAAKAMAACHLRVETDRIERLLLADPATHAFEKWEGKLSSDCIFETAKKQGDWAWHSGEGLRYALAEELVRRKLKAVALNDLDRVAPRQHDRPPYYVNDESYLSRSEREERARQRVAAAFLSRMGECVVRQSPDASKALVMSQPASSNEAAAFKVLMPAFQHCVDKSQTLEFDRTSLRGALALNYFRLAKAPRLTVKEAAE